ncbi:MAG: oligosaccharide repeat unit polymerase [Prevotella sp.]|nr:oligosaccharide repeat unit polymerase [Prevotella sp.]
MTFLIIALLLVVLFLSWKYMLQLEPAGVFAAMWVVLIATILLCHDFVIIRYYGLIFILACVICFMAGTIFCETCYTPSPKFEKELTFDVKSSKIILTILFVMAFFNPIYTLYLHGFSLKSLLSTAALLYMNNEIAIDRYSGGNAYSTFNQLFLVFSYTAPLFGGFCFRLIDKYGKIVSIMTIFPGIFTALTQSMKMGMITSIILWISGFLVCSVSYHLPLKIKFKKIIITLAIFSIFISILFISMVLRTGEISEKIIEDITNKFFTYALGYVPCFDIWYSSTDSTDYTYGGRTLFGITNFLGIMDRQQGIYDQWIPFGKNGFKGESNVYTVFRMLIEDFGPIFSCVLMFCFGLISKFSQKKLYIGNYVPLNQIVLTAVYAFVFWSFVTSFFAYTSYLAMFVLTFLILIYVQTVKKPHESTTD